MIVQLSPTRFLDVPTGTIMTVCTAEEHSFLDGEPVQVLGVSYARVERLYGDDALAAVRGLVEALERQSQQEVFEIPAGHRTAKEAEAAALHPRQRRDAKTARPHPSHEWGPLTPIGQGRCVRCGAHRHLSSGLEECCPPVLNGIAEASVPRRHDVD